MGYHKLRLSMMLVLIMSFVLFFSISPSEELFQTKGFDRTEKNLAVNLMKIYEDTKVEETNFYKNFDRVHNMFEEIKKKNNINNNYDEEHIKKEIASDLNPSLSESFMEPRFMEPRFMEPRFMEPRFMEPRFMDSSFIEMQSKGPVEEETIWRALYDTQLRRSPPIEEVHVFASEDVKKEYEEAKMDSFISQIDMIKSEFDKNLNYMNTEMLRQENEKNLLECACLFYHYLKQMNNKRSCKNEPLRKAYSTKILC
ncbi:conserved Plasmodium protein, unknown function [Plasmodium sp. gorilla clade G2]|uniref:conserved Plasmodium protein, unknown function n=1 Tax=Plasmodium sp. gorilla clade G2 TaxID=880535 RepID=UPI000D21F393|nr:conserved Plasmodium protein, unknown function [Plasmodium sp. gorilla clade G2]SOV10253.1 conserved Plasmodium protein, unknown function [Plasmodium sp. gorilla clade G2]